MRSAKPVKRVLLGLLVLCILLAGRMVSADTVPHRKSPCTPTSRFPSR